MPAYMRLTAEDYPFAPALFYTGRRVWPVSYRSLNRALNLAGTQASGADVDVFRGSVDQRFDAFDIGLEGAVGTDVRVRHGNAEVDALAAELALCHSDTSYKGNAILKRGGILGDRAAVRTQDLGLGRKLPR